MESSLAAAASKCVAPHDAGSASCKDAGKDDAVSVRKNVLVNFKATQSALT